MLDGGADPRYIGRRLLRLASEDVGNADPRAVEITSAALQSFELGSPEGELALARRYCIWPVKVMRFIGLFLARLSGEPSVSRCAQAFGERANHADARFGFAEGYRHAHGEQTDMGAYVRERTTFPNRCRRNSFIFHKRPDEGKIKSRRDN